MESVTEGVVVEWRVAVGETVAAEQIVVEVSTDKVDLEVPAPAAGRLESIAIPAGETFTVGQPLGEIAAGASGGATPAPTAGEPAPAVDAGPAPDGSAAAGTEWPQISPVARRLAIEHGIDPATVTGSGPGGMVRKADVVEAASRPAAAAAPAPSAAPAVAGEEAVILRGPAAALAGYMDESLKIPTATSFRTLSVATLDAQRRQINADLAAAGQKGKLSFTHLIAWAIVRAVRSQPVMGTGFDVVDG
jgi:2-oxoglutarate dehydrogenase E1 component